MLLFSKLSRIPRQLHAHLRASKGVGVDIVLAVNTPAVPAAVRRLSIIIILRLLYDTLFGQVVQAFEPGSLLLHLGHATPCRLCLAIACGPLPSLQA